MKNKSLDQFIVSSNVEILCDKNLNEIQGGNIIWDLFVFIGEHRPRLRDLFEEIADKLGIPEDQRPS